MAGVITTGNHPRALWPGVQEWFGRMYDKHPPEWSQIFDEVKGSKNYEEDAEVTGFGYAQVKSEGSSISYDSETQGITPRYTQKVYGLGYIVTREELEDNLYEKVSKRRSEALAFSLNQTVEVVHALILDRASNDSYTMTGGDGVGLLSTAHPTLDGTQSNELATAADFSEAALEDICVQIMSAKNSRGHQISLRPQMVIVPPNEYFNASRVLESDLQNDTANNAKNILKGMFPKGLAVNHYVDDTDAWWVKTNVPAGLKSIWRRKIEFKQDNDFDTENAKAKATVRFIPGWTDFRVLYGSMGS
jgi:hypothetical protein